LKSQVGGTYDWPIDMIISVIIICAPLMLNLPMLSKLYKYLGVMLKSARSFKPMADGPSFSYEKLVRETWTVCHQH